MRQTDQTGLSGYVSLRGREQGLTVVGERLAVEVGWLAQRRPGGRSGLKMPNALLISLEARGATIGR